MLDVQSALHEAAVIVLFGPTGAGKTTFANVASGGSMKVGHGLKSCTRDVDATTLFTVDGRDVVIVDCPGLDDTFLTESEILKSLSGFLEAAYRQDFKITGLLYLHKITDTRVGGTSIRHMNMFKELCGTDSLKNVVYVMNMWSDPPTEAELLRENELRHADEFFALPISEGAQMANHYNTTESAHDIIRKVLPRAPTVPKISREIVDEGLELEETSAGAALGLALEDEIRKLNEEIRQLREDHAQATRANNERFKKMLEAQEKKAQDKQEQLEEQIKSLQEGNKAEKEAWERRLHEYSAGVNEKFMASMNDMIGRRDAEHRESMNSMMQQHQQSMEAARRAEESRTAALKQAYDQAAQRQDSNHEIRLASLQQQQQQAMEAARRAEEYRIAVLKQAHDQALNEARRSKSGGGCVIA